jgi:hypothetical protein
MEEETMVDLDSYWRQHPQDKRSAVAFGMKAMGLAKSGQDYVECARFVVSMGLATELADMLMTNLIKRVVDIDNLGDGRPTLENAGGFGEAARILT